MKKIEETTLAKAMANVCYVHEPSQELSVQPENFWRKGGMIFGCGFTDNCQMKNIFMVINCNCQI